MGVAPAAEVAPEEWRHFESWLEKNMHAGMVYMERHRDLRRDPRKLLEGARTVISIAFNYRQDNPYPEIAMYALGEDYHKVLRRRLKEVVRQMKEEFGGEYRICIDSAPILERYWARRCGVGYPSHISGNIIVPGVGSMVFLAEILTTLDIESPPCYELGLDGNYELCIMDALKKCPTGALQPGGVVDARRCINYLTIEHQGEWSEEQKTLMSRPGAAGKLFGCDICQLACPSNQTSPKNDIIPEFKPLPEIQELISAIRSGDRDNPLFKLPTPLNRWLRGCVKR